jgi:hypothetical protein
MEYVNLQVYPEARKIVEGEELGGSRTSLVSAVLRNSWVVGFSGAERARNVGLRWRGRVDGEEGWEEVACSGNQRLLMVGQLKASDDIRL